MTRTSYSSKAKIIMRLPPSSSLAPSSALLSIHLDPRIQQRTSVADTPVRCRWHTDRVAVEGRAERGQTLGSFIRTQRRLAALSLRQLAGMTSVSNAYLSQIERGIHQPSLRVLHSLAQALDVPTTVLLEHAGMESIDDERVDATLPTAAAIQLDPELTEADRKLLLALYERLRGASR